ncbi:MAG TPA: hypothetical protein VE553_07115, partial [Candidatus Binatia bacterium]|nr:hypothetical protein [Candidatus Binatia bacterium]
RSEANHEFTVRLDHNWDLVSFLLENPQGGSVTLTADSIRDVAFNVLNIRGEEVGYVDDNTSGEEVLTLSDLDGAHFVNVFTFHPGTTFVLLHVSGNARLRRIPDQDDGRQLITDRPIRGTLDNPGDFDLFEMQLGEGEIVNFNVDSASIDPLLTVLYPSAGQNQMVSDEDSGGGLAGLNAELTYRAPHAGLYWVMVSDSYGGRVGGYTITASSRREGAPTPMAPVPTPVPIIGESGYPLLRQGAEHGFSILTPSWWIDAGEGCANTLCFYGNEGNVLLTYVEDETISATQRGQFAGTLASYIEQPTFGTILRHSWTTLTTDSGEAMEVLHYVLSGGGESLVAIFGVAVRDGAAFIVEYYISEGEYDALAPAIEESFRSFEWSEQ